MVNEGGGDLRWVDEWGGGYKGERKMREREKGVEHLEENREEGLMVNKPM